AASLARSPICCASSYKHFFISDISGDADERRSPPQGTRNRAAACSKAGRELRSVSPRWRLSLSFGAGAARREWQVADRQGADRGVGRGGLQTCASHRIRLACRGARRARLARSRRSGGKLLGMVNAVPDFGDQPKVINGCSDLFVEVFGDKGRHARSAVGMGSLPMNITVEIEAIVEVK